MDPDSLSACRDSNRLSSSFGRQGWPRQSPSYASPAGDAGPSHHATWRLYESTVDEPDRTTRVSGPCQMNGDSRPSSRRDGLVNLLPERTHTTPSQPVLVRSYSGNAEATTVKPSPMSPRRLFPFSGSKSSVPPCPSDPPPPSDKDFSIESILQAIEPDIQGTLDSIAEICGRSKLSLANEYGSHIAPLGEIRASASGLVPVEEASQSDERSADEGVVIFDDDPGLVEPGRDMHPFSFYRYLENLRQAASTLERNGATGSVSSAHPNASSSATVAAYMNAPELDVAPLPASREFVSRPKNTGRNLLAKNNTSGLEDHSSPDIFTPAVVSEVRLDAQAGGRNADTHPSVLSMDPYESSGNRAPEIVRSLISWLRWTARVAGPESHPALQSAEGRLRAMLEPSVQDGFSPQSV
ncbi:uncharacterized protein N7498_010522 [Penicillium cinerascens]|uniref:Uncharacterized protein n=1 Tax=Penicillium cinerascens TaxID=70096 RepID=A0A9W9J7V7_9EURO|nr:uncharacterized protein N7498_010522 [Penicillium cinerascens]KAJ5191537.1 hypothetical protein N7498_010522 [Penicillium cinerascens]